MMMMPVTVDTAKGEYMTVNLWGFMIGHDEGVTTRGDGGGKCGIGCVFGADEGDFGRRCCYEKAMQSSSLSRIGARARKPRCEAWGRSDGGLSSVGMYSDNNEADWTMSQLGPEEPQLVCLICPPHPVMGLHRMTSCTHFTCPSNHRRWRS